MMHLAARILGAHRLLQVHELGLRRGSCPLCAGSWQLRLRDDDVGVRCLRCGASAITQSLVDVLLALKLPLARLEGYELSARGPLVAWLAARCARLQTSEYLEGAAAGSVRDGVRCEDVQALSFADGSFDLVTATEVFEHVADDAAGFREVRRVLRDGGHFVFTVPIAGPRTVVRASAEGGRVRHHLPPAWHGDPRTAGGRALVFREYGADVCERLRAAGFAEAWIATPALDRWFGHARHVPVARR